jgi:hypothetical protein
LGARSTSKKSSKGFESDIRATYVYLFLKAR